MVAMEKSCKYIARIAKTKNDVQLTQAMRAAQFGCSTQDTDLFDAKCRHVLIEDRETGILQGCFRFMCFDTGHDVSNSYSAQFYDLQRLAAYKEPMLELGRFCVSGGVHDYAVLRVAWAYLTRYVDKHNIALIFGCASFDGVNPLEYTDAFALLKQRHLAPDAWTPQVKASEVFEFASKLNGYKPALSAANQNMPALLRTYLGMGGWVSDHAVIDRALNTLHVFTGIEINAIPKSRARLLRADAGLIEA
ncbi:MAG: GNAT family N-acetyltransferase [Amylibacter sp.]|nr:GNAT family N-acetyltransferase [Amylibacter sp.]